jgi:hypothetical protein
MHQPKHPTTEIAELSVRDDWAAVGEVDDLERARASKNQLELLDRFAL